MTTARTRCLNCSLMLMPFIRRHILAAIPDNIMTILGAWITPTAFSNEDVVCDICYTLLQEANVSHEPVTPGVGHTRVCYVCGVSVLRSRTHKVPLDSPQRNHILEWVPPHQINRLERVCRACWMAATRAVQRQQLQDAQRLDNSPVPEVLPQEQIKVEINIPAPPPLLEIQVVCRVCLAVDIKMYDMKDFKLNEMFHNITGKWACNEKEGALLRICWECAARLTAAAAFRDKALLSDSLLKDLVYVSKNHIAVLKRLNHSSLKSSLTIQTVFTSSEIGCGDAVSETKEDELFSGDDETDISEVKTELKINLEEKENGFDEKDDKPQIEIDIGVDDIGEKKETDIKLAHIAEETETDFEEDDIGEGKETDIELEGIVEETETDFEEDDIEEGKETDVELEDIAEEKKTDFEEEEPLIEVLVKTEVESDPIAENIFNVQMQVVKNEKFFELEHFDDDFMPPNEDNEDEIENTEVQIRNNDNILSEDPPMTINDGDIVLEDNVGEKPKVVVIGNILNDSASEGGIQRLPEPVAVNKVKKKKICPNRLNDTEKQKIIALKAKGLSDSEIAKETGKSISCITAWWHRYSQEDSEITEDTLPDTIEEPDQNICDDPVVPGRDFVACSPTVRRRLYQAGLEHILMKKPGVVNTGQKVSKLTANIDDNLKQQIIALKQEGLTNSRIAYLLETSTHTIIRWWRRWCNEGHLNTRKRTGRRKMTSAQEDQLLVDRVQREQTVHTPSLARQFGMSPRTCRRRLYEAGFKPKLRERYVPLKAGRTKNVDEHLKQRIITMKQNGASVTDMAREFRVPRTTIYQWWRRWCNENGITTTSENNTNATEQEQSSANDSNTEKCDDLPKNVNDIASEKICMGETA